MHLVELEIRRTTDADRLPLRLDLVSIRVVAITQFGHLDELFSSAEIRIQMRVEFNPLLTTVVCRI